MGPVSRAGTGAIASVAAHVVAGFGLAALLTAREIPDQAAPKSRIELATTTLERKEAVPTDAGGATAPGVLPDDRQALIGTVRRRSAVLAEAEVRRLADADTSGGEPVSAVTPAGAPSIALAGVATIAPAVSDRSRVVQSAPVQGAAPLGPAPVPAPLLAQAEPPVSPALNSSERSRVAESAQIERAAAIRPGPLSAPVLAQAEPPVSPVLTSSERSRVAESAPIERAAAIRPGPLSAPVLAQAEPPVSPVLAVSAPDDVATSRVPERRIASAAGTAALSRPAVAEAPRPLSLATAQPEAARVVAVVAVAPPAIPTVAAGAFFPPVAADAPAAGQPTPERVAVPAGDLAGETVTAIMEFSGDGKTTLDPLGLLAVTAFVAPQSAGAEGRELREGIGDILSAVPCSRLQTSFDSATGAVELRGHIPDEALRVALTGALQTRIGDALPVVDRLHLLKEPQCGILAQLDMLGLPQSEEQFTDPGLIGEDLFVRDYAFSDGERMVIELEAADYPAFIYVDYFDARGNVLHLMPNEVLPLRRYRPGEAFTIGAAGSGLDLIVEAPFGQDIAIALASDRPLYDGLRPVSEPADEYLAFLRQRIAEVAPERAEWVYLLVTTSDDR